MLSPWGIHGFHGKGAPINSYIWCAVGAAIGALAGGLMGTRSHVARIEEILVGVFGAFIGGEFVAAQVIGPAAEKSFTMGALMMAVGGAVVMLGLLMLMRRAVGPLKISKSRQRH